VADEKTVVVEATAEDVTGPEPDLHRRSMSCCRR
jgi:hypothetical protein